MTPIDVQFIWIKVKVKLLSNVVRSISFNPLLSHLIQWMPHENICFMLIFRSCDQRFKVKLHADLHPTCCLLIIWWSFCLMFTRLATLVDFRKEIITIVLMVTRSRSNYRPWSMLLRFVLSPKCSISFSKCFVPSKAFKLFRAKRSVQSVRKSSRIFIVIIKMANWQWSRKLNNLFGE